MSPRHIHVSHWLQTIRAEYREMPGLSLTKAQMQRLWGMEAYLCDALVDALVAGRVLRETRGGTYVAQ
jgi:hypothetical protein